MKMNKRGGFEFALDNLGSIIVVVIFLIALLALVLILGGPYLTKIFKSI